MITLAIDSSGNAGSVALLRDDRLLGEIQLDSARRTTQTLIPAIHDLLKQSNIDPGDIALVATTLGPGSFTGLRISITAAKSFAYAVNAHVLGLNTLDVLAAGMPPEVVQPGQRLQVVLDAQRGELVVGEFQRVSPQAGHVDLRHFARIAGDRLLTMESWRSALTSDVLVTGGGLKRVDHQQVAARIADESHWEPRASVLGVEAWRHYQLGRRDNLWKLAPLYLRPSYADEKVRPQ